MSAPKLVEAFYQRIWNEGDERAISELIVEGFLFRGSLGAELRGRKAFQDYVLSIRASLASYRCEILECVTEGDKALLGRFAEVESVTGGQNNGLLLLRLYSH